MKLNILKLMNLLQEATIKLEYASTLEEITKYDNEINYVRNQIAKMVETNTIEIKF